jgi:hypothetical protein
MKNFARVVAWAFGAAGIVAGALPANAGEKAAHRTGGAPGAAWVEVTGSAEWEGRAGLQAIDLGKDLFVMGGRGAFNPFGTTIFQDVWKSRDRGESWEKVSGPAEWPARAYFQAVRHRGRIFVLGGQNFDAVPNPGFPGNCPPAPAPCFPFVPASKFFADVWSSEDGANWVPETTDAGWAGRAGLSAVVFRGEIYVFGGSQGDDASTGGQGRVLFNDVWKSRDGRSWTRLTAAAPWAPRAGAAAVVKDGYIYLLGGERGFTCGPVPPSVCVPERDLYFNDVWRTRDGRKWDRVTAAAGWSPRPGHQCVVALDQIVCFGGYGEPTNPNDAWASRDGRCWVELKAPLSPPWRAVDPDGVKYDFDALVVPGGPRGLVPAILTFGGDRERFELPPDVNATRVDNDVWRLGLPPLPRH